MLDVGPTVQILYVSVASPATMLEVDDLDGFNVMPRKDSEVVYYTRVNSLYPPLCCD